MFWGAQKLNANFSTALGVGAPDPHVVQGLTALANYPLISLALFFTLRDVHLLPVLPVTQANSTKICCESIMFHVICTHPESPCLMDIPVRDGIHFFF